MFPADPQEKKMFYSLYMFIIRYNHDFTIDIY